MPFGWSLSPYWENRLARPIKQWLIDRGWEHCWWVDDIMLLAPTKQETEHRATELINLLTTVGMQINVEKNERIHPEYRVHWAPVQSQAKHHQTNCRENLECIEIGDTPIEEQCDNTQIFGCSGKNPHGRH